MESLEAVLARVRAVLGVKTDKQMSEILGIPYATIGTWKDRKRIPKGKLFEIAAKLEVAPEYLESGINIISGGNNQVGSLNTQNNYTQSSFVNKHEAELIRHLKENNPDNEYKDIEDIKKRLMIKDDKELAALLRVKEYIIQNIRDEGGSPAKDIQEAARVVERKIKAAAASYGGLVDEYGEWAVLRTQEYSGVVLDKKRLRLFYLIVHYGNEFMIDQVTQEFEALKRTMDKMLKNKRG